MVNLVRCMDASRLHDEIFQSLNTVRIVRDHDSIEAALKKRLQRHR
jgi:hypothetical protein